MIEDFLAFPKNSVFLMTNLAWMSELCVNFGPFKQSPTAKIDELEVHIYESTFMPFPSNSTLASSSPNPSTLGVLPTANKIVSTVSSLTWFS